MATTDNGTRNTKMFFGIIGALVLLLIIIFFPFLKENNAQRTQDYERKQQEIEQKIKWFNSAKASIRANKLLDSELRSAKTNLESINTRMSEYTEAQELLQIINKRISVKEAKELKTAEEALYTPGGKRVHSRHPDWDSNVCNTIAKGQIYIGMSKEQVAAAWGRPYTINTTTGAYGTHEQWVMHEMGKSYVYFENGICTTIQN